jgi:hypothetical protein
MAEFLYKALNKASSILGKVSKTYWIIAALLVLVIAFVYFNMKPSGKLYQPNVEGY